MTNIMLAKESIKDLDPRIKLLLVIVFTSVQMVATSNLVVIWNYLLVFTLYKYSNRMWLGIKICAVPIILTIILCFLETQSQNGILGTMAFVLFFLVRLYMFMAIGYWFSKTTKVGDFISCLQSMKLPQGMIISLVVFFRYMPTVWNEFWYISGSMKIRGVGIGIKNILMYPVRTIEYAFVPLLIRSMTIADRLSESALTRGLDMDNERSNFRQIKIGFKDISVGVIFTSLSLCMNYIR